MVLFYLEVIHLFADHMEKDKSRGRKHILDKRKYKGNTVKNPKHVPLPTRPVLESNEDRYVEEKAEHSQSFQLSSSTDFGVLSKTPISKGHYFLFKSDKLIAEEAETKSSGDLFSIDVQAIHNSILAVPFCERIGMDNSYFSESEKKTMKSEAAGHMKSILEKARSSEVRNHKEFKKIDFDISEEGNIQEDTRGGVLLSCTEKSNNSFTEDKRTIPNDELEQWLDDILGD